MWVSSFSRYQHVTALVGAAAIALLSRNYFAHLWRGVVVSGAGNHAANGFYKYHPTSKRYLKSESDTGGWRVPNVYDLVVSRGPDTSVLATSAPVYQLRPASTNSTGRTWWLTGPAGVEYGGVSTNPDNTPPSTGWVVISAGLDPPPEVFVSGQKVAPDPDIKSQRPSSILAPTDGMPNEGPSRQSEVDRHPGTVLLLAIILTFMYYLWSQKVSLDRVAISYSLFWEKREYWRLFTASFAHLDWKHLAANTFSMWNMRALERHLGTFNFLNLTLSLVVTTSVVKMAMRHFLIKHKGVESQRRLQSLGFSAVLFAYTTYAAVVMPTFCPLGNSNVCFKTWGIPLRIGGLPDLAVNFGPFVSLAATQYIASNSSLIGHLAGIVSGYLMVWGALGWVSTPVLAGVSAILIIQRSNSWAWKVPRFSLMVNGWTRGDVTVVVRARMLQIILCAHICLTSAILGLFTWGTGLAEVMALFVGCNALQALKCCCWHDSKPTEHRVCVTLLKVYAALSGILLLSDLLSFGAIFSQSRYLEWSGVSKFSRERGLILFLVAAAVHGAVVAACIEAVVIFREGQVFLSGIGLKQVVATHIVSASAERAATQSSHTPPVSGRFFPGVGNVLGTAASNAAKKRT